MSNAFPARHPQPIDNTDYPMPTGIDERSGMALAVTVPRARRELKAALAAMKAAMAALKAMELGEPVQLDGIAIDALVCGATDSRFPLDADEPPVDRLRERAEQGELKDSIALAMDELEDVLVTLDAALSALKAISLLDEPIPAEWGNLAPVLLARKLNVLGHTLLRGRIAGVNL